MLRWLKYLLILIVAVIIIGAGGIAWLFCRAAPQYSGHVAMPGLTAAVNVYRDDHGVPHIFAANMNDAARALGYIHADERLFQMEMNRRAGAGRLSEVLGSDMLDIDKFTRTLGLYRLAQESFTSLSPQAQQLLTAYADGVNAWLTAHGNALPPEFLLLHINPEPWTPADSLVWGKLMAVQLSGNYRFESLRAKLAGKLSPEQIQMLLPPPPDDAPVTTRPELRKSGAIENPERQLQVGEALSQQRPSPLAGEVRRGVLSRSASFSSRGENPTPVPTRKGRGTLLDRANNSPLDHLGLFTGLARAASNEWVISGARTESGKPILANDPHLGLEAPILWYLARIKTPDFEMEGATVPGLPVVLLGQNGHIAWGFTTTGSDVQDLFIETIDPKNADQYLAPGGAIPFETRDETIHVKDAPDETLHVRITRHGPVLSDIDPKLAGLAGDGKMMALSFTALTSNDTTPEALMRIDHAENWQQFTAALQLYQAPPQNIVFADTAGNIGFVAAGLVPIRKKGDGSIPVDGSVNDFDWSGTIPVNQWPQLYNPPAGFIFNANNAVVGPDSAYYYGADWEEPFRAERLQQFFDTLPKHTLDTSAAMQADKTEAVARQLLPFLLQQKFSDPRAAQAIEMLRNWNAVMDKDKPEPLIFEAWLYQMHQLLLADKADDSLKTIGPFDALAIVNILASPQHWCDTPDPAASCNDVIQKAFTAAINMLTDRDGMDMAAWRWGNEQTTILRNKFWSHIPVLRDMTDLSVASGGDFYTLDRGGSSTTNPDHPFERTHGAGFRGIYDLSDPTKSRFMIATGESGHVLTQHYGDLVTPWEAVQGFALTGSEDELKLKGAAELVFEAGQ